MPVVKNEWGRVGFRHMGQCYHTSLHFRSFPSAGIDLRLWTGTVAMMNRSGWLLLHSVSAHDLASISTMRGQPTTPGLTGESGHHSIMVAWGG
jgi:hypothetical protein